MKSPDKNHFVEKAMNPTVFIFIIFIAALGAVLGIILGILPSRLCVGYLKVA